MLNDEEWREHRRTAVQVGDLGLCSVVNGQVKIEGHMPFLVSRAHDYKYTLHQRHWSEYERFLVRNGIPNHE